MAESSPEIEAEATEAAEAPEATETAEAGVEEASGSPQPETPPVAVARRPTRPAIMSDLPGYSRSLLRVKVPVMVTLAVKRQSLGQIVELGLGSIIQFDKSCEDMLQLDVAGKTVANGEAVKVGDKFGLRITSIILPEERFTEVSGRRAAGGKR